MATFNPKKRQIDCKIVYYGPGLSGKTTNLIQIHKGFRNQVTGELVSINTEGDRTLYFDFLPIGLGKIRGCDVRLQLYTVPGQVQYRSTRKLVLRGVDGVVFVADSQPDRREKNMLSLRDLQENLREYGLSIFKIPLVLQYNKRDLAAQGAAMMPLEQMEQDLNRQLQAPSFEASAIRGEGVAKTLESGLQLTLKVLQQELRWAE